MINVLLHKHFNLHYNVVKKTPYAASETQDVNAVHSMHNKYPLPFQILSHYFLITQHNLEATIKNINNANLIA